MAGGHSVTMAELREMAEKQNGRLEKSGLGFRWVYSGAYGRQSFNLVYPKSGSGAVYADTGYGTKREVFECLEKETGRILLSIGRWLERQDAMGKEIRE